MTKGLEQMYVVLAVAALLLGFVFYLGFAPGPRRWRAYRRGQKLLDAGKWGEVLALVKALRPNRLSSAWQARLENLAGEAHQRGVDEKLKEKAFEEALEHATEAARHLSLDAGEQQNRVQEALLAEVRRLFATGPAETAALEAMIARASKLTGTCPPEAAFWEALSLVRQGHLEQAIPLLATLEDQVGKQFIDPPLYLGMLLHRLGRPQEALRHLGDANRLDSNCPFVPWQMGVSIMVSGGDSGMAMRALQRALGPRGLAAWQGQPERLWVEALPEGKSYVRRLAARHRYVCPILGPDLTIVQRQGQLALAQALYKQERFQESADLYGKLMQESPPTVMLSRGYGLALARLGQYDQAYKHLRIALEQEDPKDPFTAGYLARCGALGRPTNPEDKPRNITWALRLLAKYPLPCDAEWTGLISSVHAEARKIGMTTGQEEQELLCDSLASIQAHDARSAVFYAQLATTFPEAVKPIHAWLYARAAAVHGVTSPIDLDLFVRVFQNAGGARAYFEQQGWDFSEIEYTYLARCASQAPGRFPEVLGSDYPTRGEAFLLSRSREQEQAGKKDPAREAVEVLLRLAPSSLEAHDRLACLHYRTGNVDRAVELLDGWCKLAPADHWPLVRQAIIEQERGNAQQRAEAIQRALGLTRGTLRAAVAFLGARLALRDTTRPEADLRPTEQLLEECLREQPDHPDALWCLAAVRSIRGDREALSSQAPLMDRPGITDPRFHFLGAVCHLAARDYRRVIALADRAGNDSQLAVECLFLRGWAHLRLGEIDLALQMLRKVAEQSASPSAVYARALLGQLAHQRNAPDDAVAAWSSLDPSWRGKWNLDEPLRQTVLLAGLVALEENRFEQAAERFKEAGRLGLRDRRLGGLITLALVKAGQRLLFDLERTKTEG